MRRPVLILIICVVALAVIVIGGLSLLDVNHYRPRIQAEMQQKLGRPVTLGNLGLHLFPLSVRIDGLTIGDDPAYGSSRPFATAKEVYASVSLFSLLKGEPTINSLRLDNPQIELIQNASGVWNFSTLGSTGTQNAQAQTPTKENPQPSPTKGNAQGTNLTLHELKIVDGQVAVTDQRTKKSRSTYNHIDLSLANFAPGEQFDLDLTAHFPGSGKEILQFSGKGGPIQAGTAAPPINGHLSLQQISVAGLNSIAAGTIPPKTDGSISGDANVSSQGDNLAAKGSLKVDDPVVQGAKLPYPVESNFDVALDRKQNQLHVQSGSIKTGPTAVSLSGLANLAAEPTALNVKLQTKDASITDLAKLASAFGVAFDADDQVKGRLSANLNAQGPLNNLAIQGTISSPQLQAQELVLQNVNANCNMKGEVVTLNPVTATVYGGQENGTITVDTKPAHPACSVKIQLHNVDTNGLLSAVSSVKNTVYGKLATDAFLTFTVDSSANLAKTLNGTADFNIADGQLKNVNILNELAKIGKFTGGAVAGQTGPDTAIEKGSGAFNIRNGVATTNNLVLALKAASLSAVGSLNLVDQGLDMHVNAVFASDSSKAVGGTSVGGFLNTALANNKGELVIPVLVKGSMAHPIFAPDVEGVAKMKLHNLLPTSGDPSKSTTGLVNSILGRATGKGSDQQQGKEQNPVDSLLNQLGKKH